MVPLRRAGERQRGAILFPRKENSPPYPPQEKGTRGLPPRPRTLAVSILKSCSACGLHSRWQLCCLTDVAYPLRIIGCGVHGFAMNPCESLRLATAPYCREARVTFARRQTACEIAALLTLAALWRLAVDGNYCALLQDGQSGTRKGCAASVRRQSRQRLRNSG